MRVKSLFFVLAASLLAASSYAQTYAGFSVGQAQFKDSSLDVSANGSNLFQTKGELDKSSIAGSLYAGYEFNPYFAIELTAGGIDAIEMDYASVGRMMYLEAAPKLTLPFSNNFNAFGKLGIAKFSAEIIYSDRYLGSHTVEDSVALGIVTLGAEYALNNRTSLRFSWDYLRPEFEIEPYQGVEAKVATDIHIFSAGLNYKF